MMYSPKSPLCCKNFTFCGRNWFYLLHMLAFSASYHSQAWKCTQKFRWLWLNDWFVQYRTRSTMPVLYCGQDRTLTNRYCAGYVHLKELGCSACSQKVAVYPLSVAQKIQQLHVPQPLGWFCTEVVVVETQSSAPTPFLLADWLAVPWLWSVLHLRVADSSWRTHSTSQEPVGFCEFIWNNRNGYYTYIIADSAGRVVGCSTEGSLFVHCQQKVWNLTRFQGL